MDDVNDTLLEDLLTHFDEAELRQFCQQLGNIGYDDLAGTTPRGKMTHLLAYIERRGRQRRLVQHLTTLRPQLTEKYRSILHESDRIQAQAAAIDSALSWLDELAAGTGAALEEPPTTSWPTEAREAPQARLDSKLSWIDRLAQGSGAAVAEGPTMSWPEKEREPAAPEPYQVGGCLIDPNHFYGRDDALQRLRSRLLDMGSSVIVGLPYVGKSSLLYALAYHERLAPEHRCLIAHIDLASDHFAHKPPALLLNAAWQQWMAQLERLPDPLGPVSPIAQPADFARCVQALHRRGDRPVLCLDGFTESVRLGGPLDESLLTLWRELGNKGQIAFVLTAERPLSALLPREWFRSDFDTIFYQLELGLLSEQAARQLLAEPAQQRGVTIPPAVIERWLDYCGAYPIFLQMAGSLLWNSLGDNGRLSAADEAALQYKFRQWAAPHWQRIWQSLSVEARQGFPREPTTPTTPAERIVYRFLAGRGLLVMDGARYRPFSTAFAQWLAQAHPPSEQTPLPISDMPASEDEKSSAGWLGRLWGGG
jgi:hypothetical protein